MSEILGAKIWWRWVTHSSEPWARLWSKKYTRDRPSHLLIHFNEALSGSTIWLKALAGKSIIHEHSFWEIKDGCRVMFWEDSWNQFPIHRRTPRLALIKQQEIERGRVLVNQSWGSEIQVDYHRWDFPEKPDLMSEEDWVAFQEELNRFLIKNQ